MLNDHFVQAEVEYLRQQRLRAAAEHRRARSAARVRSLRQRLSSVVAHLAPGRAAPGQAAPGRAAPGGAATGRATGRAVSDQAVRAA